MKKLITLVLALVCVLGLVGCNQKAVSASEVYSFPEPTTMITVSFYSQGEETAFEIGSEEYDSNDLSTTPVINWFYDLKLTACDEPEAVEGSESYEFYVKGESAFTYEDTTLLRPDDWPQVSIVNVTTADFLSAICFHRIHLLSILGLISQK